MLHAFEAGPCDVDHVGIGDELLRMVHRTVQPELPGLVERGIEDILRRAADELDAVGTTLLGFLNDGARGHGVVHGAADLVKHRVDVDARRDDLVALAALLDVDQPFDRMPAAKVADRGDTVRHPELQDIVRAAPSVNRWSE